MRRTTSALTSEPIEPAEPLSQIIKGQYALRAIPEPASPLMNLSIHGKRIFFLHPIS